ncbi:Uncharacterised protein [Escherichia coli]|uniref:Uncharacterized protein n=1 Tax=Escherichia coli TaxID=562 RepID=A0A377E1A2_ECOLX|nr:Uncharacterised protein [Escherichia coli]
MQLCEQCFSHHPQRTVKLHVPVNATHGTSMRSFAFNITPAESALNQVFLNPLVRGSQVIALILPAARGEDLRFSHRLVVFTKAVCEGGFCQCLLCRGGNSNDCMASRFSSTRSKIPSTSYAPSIT